MQSAPPITADPSGVARRVQSVVQLFQLSGSFVAFPSAPGAGAPEPLQATFAQADPAAEVQGGTLLVVRLGYRCVVGTGTIDPFLEAANLKAEAPPPGVRFFAEAEFVVAYVLSAGENPTNDELQAFARVNAPLNIVPYWREYLDSCVRRAGMPPLLAPVHKTEPLSAAGPKT